MPSKRSLGVSRTYLRKKFGTEMTFRNYRDKEIVFSQGDPGDCFLHRERDGEAHGGLYAEESYNRHPAARQLFWRRLSSRTVSEDLHRQIHWTIQCHSIAKREDASHAPERRAFCKAIRWISTFTGCSNRGRSDRSILQFQRKAAGPGSVVVWRNNQGIQVGFRSEGQPINPGGDGWYHAAAGKQIHEPVQEAGLGQLQRGLESK